MNLNHIYCNVVVDCFQQIVKRPLELCRFLDDKYFILSPPKFEGGIKALPKVRLSVNLIKVISGLEVVDQQVSLLDPVLILGVSSKLSDKSHHIRPGDNVDISLRRGSWSGVLMFSRNIEAHLFLDNVALVSGSVGHPGGDWDCHGDLGSWLIGPRNVPEQLPERCTLWLARTSQDGSHVIVPHPVPQLLVDNGGPLPLRVAPDLVL